ncbi:MAG: FAD-binding oxidoreductase [Pseudonocardiaceae bacterium]
MLDGAAAATVVGAPARPPQGNGLGTRPETLALLLRGSLFVSGDAGYDDARAGYNLAVAHRPAAVVEASGVADVMVAVEFATRHELPIGVLSTGHGASVPADGAILVNVRRMRGVRVDPTAAVARIEAGARWADVIHEAAAFGLAPLSGSSPQVGAVGYTLGGGLGLLGRAFGYAADHVRSVDVVTRHGMLRQVSPQQYADLFWALRGGKGNFGVVTSMEVGLFPVPRLYGGGLFFRGSTAAEVLSGYRRWVRTVPDELGSSIALTRFPWQPDLPEELRGRFVAHVRIAYPGTAAEGEQLVRPLRRIGLPLLDTVTDRPYVTSGEIHHDPTVPFALAEASTCLRELDEDAADELMHLAGPDSTCPLRLVELRHLGGALSRPPQVPNAVGNRDAGFLLYLAGVSTTGTVAEYSQLVLDRMVPWSTGGSLPNFLGAADTAPRRVRSAYAPEDYRRLVRVKRAYDPENLFRITHNIPPTE